MGRSGGGGIPPQGIRNQETSPDREWGVYCLSTLAVSTQRFVLFFRGAIWKNMGEVKKENGKTCYRSPMQSITGMGRK